MNSNGKYASVRVGTHAWCSTIMQRRLKTVDYKPTVEKKASGLWWNSGNMYVPVEVIFEVLDGDISEYTL